MLFQSFNNSKVFHCAVENNNVVVFGCALHDRLPLLYFWKEISYKVLRVKMYCGGVLYGFNVVAGQSIQHALFS